MTGPAPRPFAAIDAMAGAAALPRDNGEIRFASPWEARAFALAVAVVEHEGLDWDAFRSRLVAAVASAPERPYYESWAVALEALVVDLGLASEAAIGAATPLERAPL